MSIRQCEKGTNVCTEYIVTDSRFSRIELTVARGVEYVYTMLMYQEDEVVLVSQPFLQMESHENHVSKCLDKIENGISLYTLHCYHDVMWDDIFYLS